MKNRVLSVVILLVMCFSFCGNAFSEASEADQKAEKIFSGLAQSYNSALAYLESLQKMMDKNSASGNRVTEKPDAFWFYDFLDILNNTRTYTRLFLFAKEVRPDAEDTKTSFIYDTLIVPVYEAYNKNGYTSDGLTSTLISINNMIWRDEEAQERMEEQKQALRQFRKDYPNYELLADLQDLYKTTFNIVDYSYNERIGTTESSWATKIQEYQDIKRNLQGSFDMYFDWPDSLYSGSLESYRDFYVTYWKEAHDSPPNQNDSETISHPTYLSLHAGVQLGMTIREVVQAEVDAGNTVVNKDPKAGGIAISPDEAETVNLSFGMLYYYGELAGGNKKSHANYKFDGQRILNAVNYFINSSKNDGRKLYDQIEKLLKEKYGEPSTSAATKTRLDVSAEVSKVSSYKDMARIADFSQWIVNQTDGISILIEHVYQASSSNGEYNFVNYAILDESSKGKSIGDDL